MAGLKQHSLWDDEGDLETPRFRATADRDLGREEWSTGGNIDRDGVAAFTHIIRAPDDPEETMARGRGKRDPNAWRKLRKVPASEWSQRIAEHLADGRARTFNAICVEMLGRTADVMYAEPFDDGLWLAVERGDVEHTMAGPILFRRRS